MPSPGLRHLFFVVALGLAALGALSASPGDEDEVRAYLGEFADRWTHAARAEELEGYYAADATHIDARGRWVPRREALSIALAPPAARGAGASARIDVARVSFLAARVALVDGTLAVTDAAGRKGERLQRFSFVVKKTGGGWTIAASRVMAPDDDRGDGSR